MATDSDDNSVENFTIDSITTIRKSSTQDFDYKATSPAREASASNDSPSQSLEANDATDASQKAFHFWKQLENDELYLEFSSHNYDPGDYLQKTVSERKDKSSTSNNSNKNLERDSIPSATDSTLALNKLSKSLFNIDGYIRNEMIWRNKELLSQSDDIQNLESNLHVVSDKVNILNSYVNRIKSGIIDPFYEYKRKTLQLNNIQYCESLLRNILKCKKKLNSLQSIFNAKQQKKDSIIKAATLVCELRAMIYSNNPSGSSVQSEMNLSGVAVLDTKKSYIDSVFQQIRDLGKQRLAGGLRTLNQSEIATSLQIFYNLGVTELEDIILEVIETCEEQSRQQIRKCFNVDENIIVSLGDEKQSSSSASAADRRKSTDGSGADSKNDGTGDGTDVSASGGGVTTPGGGGSSSTGGTTTKLSWKSSLWLRLDKVMNHNILGSILQIWNLEKVLRKKSDIQTRKLFIEMLQERRSQSQGQANQFTKLTLLFWGKLVQLIKEEFEQAANNSSFVNNVFINEYPRLHLLFDDFYGRLSETTSPSMEDMTLSDKQFSLLSKICGDGHYKNLMATIDDFESLFISKCVARIREPLGILFDPKKPLHSIPTVADMTTLFTTFYNELKMTEDVSRLQFEMSKQIYLGIEQLIAHLTKKLLSYNTDKLRNAADALGTGSKDDPNGAGGDLQSQLLSAIKHNSDIFNCINRLFEHIYQLWLKSQMQNNAGGAGAGNMPSMSMKQSKSVSIFSHKKINIDAECVVVMNACWKRLYDFDCYIFYSALLFVSNIDLKRIGSAADGKDEDAREAARVEFGYGMRTDVLRVFLDEMRAAKYGVFRGNLSQQQQDRVAYLQSLNEYWQSVSQILFGIFNDGMAKRNVLMQWCMWLSLMLMDSLCVRSYSLPLQGAGTDENDCGKQVGTELMQFVHILRMFEERYNADIVPCLLMLQQLKRAFVQYYSVPPGGWHYGKLMEHVANISKECPNVPARVQCAFLLSLLNSNLADVLTQGTGAESGKKAQMLANFDMALNDVIGVEINQYMEKMVLTAMKQIFVRYLQSVKQCIRQAQSYAQSGRIRMNMFEEGAETKEEGKVLYGIDDILVYCNGNVDSWTVLRMVREGMEDNVMSVLGKGGMKGNDNDNDDEDIFDITSEKDDQISGIKSKETQVDFLRKIVETVDEMLDKRE